MISLEGTIRTCKVDTAWANKMQSDRIFNPNLMVCPPWNGVDTSGRGVLADSYMTKIAGCNSATDRVNVENDLRPQYIQYVNLDAAGIRGVGMCAETYINPDTVCNNNVMKETHSQTGQFGLTTGFIQNVRPNCLACQNYPDRRAYGEVSQNRRSMFK